MNLQGSEAKPIRIRRDHETGSHNKGAKDRRGKKARKQIPVCEMVEGVQGDERVASGSRWGHQVVKGGKSEKKENLGVQGGSLEIKRKRVRV